MLVNELKSLIIKELHLDDVNPDEIKPNDPLFGGGLELDSIDALELSIVLERIYGVSIKSGDDRNAEIFASLNGLVKFVEENRSK